MLHYLKLPLVHVLILFGGFIALVIWRTEQPTAVVPPPAHDRVVIAAPVLTALYGGDHFLAANLETIRLSSTGVEYGRTDDYYLIRAHKVVTQLNACHEDNYYLANALLTWGSAVTEGSDILKQATRCRHWDAIPPFLYGFNQYFFNRDITTAQAYLEIAATRSQKNAAAFRKLAIMIEVEQIEDEKIALEFLTKERDRASSAKLYAMLDKRVKRLEGLVLLRNAQRTYEQRVGKPLQEPEHLISAGILKEIPQDPMKWGYEFKNGQFILKQIKFGGL